ncbi:MAG: hypothetical protein M3014_12455 [Chloroflexota bacterium]|nr:hypothetical protein [Chloroflexota bacterium]
MVPRRGTHLLSYLALSALAVPMVAGWDGVSAHNLATTAHNYGTFFRDTPGVKATQLSATEVRALGLPAASYSAMQTAAFANSQFQHIWERTDKPVASSQVQRSYYWGPQPNSAGLLEDYSEGQAGKRVVQYFDKSRMELNNPNADPNSPFFVSNGLLTVELISGKMQVGNSTYVDRYPADIPLASDPDDTNAPTYLSLQGVANTPLSDHPSNSKVGSPVTATISRNGQVGDDPTKVTYPNINVVYFDPATKHNVPQAIWQFLNDTGPVYDSTTSKTGSARLSDPWFYASGLPISDAYWARVKIAGQQQDVLIQAFERRIVTYVPNGVPGFKVQMGNIGQHYYDWRYKNAGQPQVSPTPAGQPTALPVPGTPVAKPTATQAPAPPTNTPSNPAADCSGIPNSQNATVTPNCGPGGTIFRFSGRGFQPGENVGIYVTVPDQSVAGAPFQAAADGSGSVGGIGLNTDPSFPTGIWAITFEGTSSHNKAIGYFKITSTAPSNPTPGPTANPNASSCSDVPASPNMEIQPSNCAKAGTRFLFTARGFQSGETVGVYLTEPSQAVYGAPFQLTANADGTAGAVSITTQSNFPLGIWALTFEGISSHNKAIGYFKLTPP